MHIWDIQASLDDSGDLFEATIIMCSHEVYLTDMLTDPNGDNGVDIRWQPEQVE